MCMYNVISNILECHMKSRRNARNEGKIKAYESCSDVRAWSHDVRARDRYLREWMKGDMTVCFIPVSTLSKFLRIMTYKSRGKVTPRCHPDCKSKAVLENICTSCDAIKDCLKNNSEFHKYFDEEEFDTCHWPCERCMEALKSIKMFWKIIVEKLFNLNLLKNDELKEEECPRCDSVRSVAKQWQEEIVQQAIFVKSLKPLWSKAPFLRSSLVKSDDKEDCSDYRQTGTIMTKTASYTIKSVKATDTSSLPDSVVKRSHRRLVSYSRQSRMVDKYCETCNENNDESVKEELNTYKTNLLDLQKRFCEQQGEIDKFRTENRSLKMELQSLYKKMSCKCAMYNTATLRKSKDVVAVIPKPFESCTDESMEPAKDIDSEMIITMKNCKNETYRHISLLQVLHKSNGPILNNLNAKETCCKKEDPINILTRVQETFGEIVRREMTIANERNNRKVDVDATFHRMNSSRSAPSCSTMSASSTEFYVSSCSDKNVEIINI